MSYKKRLKWAKEKMRELAKEVAQLDTEEAHEIARERANELKYDVFGNEKGTYYARNGWHEIARYDRQHIFDELMREFRKARGGAK